MICLQMREPLAGVPCHQVGGVRQPHAGLRDTTRKGGGGESKEDSRTWTQKPSAVWSLNLLCDAEVNPALQSLSPL